MFEIKTEVKTYKVEKQCECGGFFEHTPGFALATFPPQYPHKCNMCRKTETFNYVYPKIEYETVSNNNSGEEYQIDKETALKEFYDPEVII